MAPKTRVTEEMILETAFEIIRENGYGSLNARMIADRLKCSTQPVLYHFKTMDEIRDAVYRTADAYHTGYILKDMENTDSPFLSIGLAYMRFGYEEPELFRFLFQSNRFDGRTLQALADDPDLEPVRAAACRELECGGSGLGEKLTAFVIAVHGYASLLANNALDYDEADAERILKMIFNGMKGC